ncbi:MAG: PEP-utilizing enzyme, partial [Pseudomonadales bacterium]
AHGGRPGMGTAGMHAAGPGTRTPTRGRAAQRRDQGSWVLFKPMAENFTEPLTPMTADLIRRMLPPGCRFFDGRLYIDLDRAARLCPFKWSEEELADVLLLRGGIPELTWNWRRLPLLAAAGAVAYLLEGISWHRTSRLTPASLAEYAWTCDRVRNAPDYDVVQGLHRLVFGRHPLEPMGRMAFYVNVSSGRYFLLLGALMKLLQRYAPDFDRHLISQLCSGDGQTRSRQMIEGVRALADVARGDEALQREMLTVDGSQLVSLLAALPQEHPFATAVTSFLSRFGHRCQREMELATPRWREDPAALLLMVRNYLKAGPQSAEDSQATGERAEQALRAALPRRWQQRLAGYLVARIRYYVALRENTRHYHTMAMDVTRSKLLDLEQRLLAESRLRSPGDIFYLTWEEADGLGRAKLGWQDVAGNVRRRRRSRSRAARSGASEVLQAGNPMPTRVSAAATAANGDTNDGTVLTGQCASPGTGEGRVRVILDPSTAADLEAGDVLVAPYTDPAWTPLFPLASAVVVEVGSFLSHAGTVAREYRIPCLVEVADCTSRLRDGQRVRVLASEGRIEVLEP